MNVFRSMIWTLKTRESWFLAAGHTTLVSPAISFSWNFYGVQIILKCFKKWFQKQAVKIYSWNMWITLFYISVAQHSFFYNKWLIRLKEMVASLKRLTVLHFFPMQISKSLYLVGTQLNFTFAIPTVKFKLASYNG